MVIMWKHTRTYNIHMTPKEIVRDKAFVPGVNTGGGQLVTKKLHIHG